MISTPAPPPSYNPGDRVRVLVNEPYSTELVAGDIVTVTAIGEKVEPDGSTLPVLFLATAHGQRILPFDVVEPFVPDYAPAEPDEIIDAQVKAIFDAETAEDPEFEALVRDAGAALGATDPDVSPDLDGGAVTEEEHRGSWEPYEDNPHYSYTDYAGDEVEIVYAERQCPTHKIREGCFFIAVNDDRPVHIPAAHIGNLIGWLAMRQRDSKRPQ